MKRNAIILFLCMLIINAAGYGWAAPDIFEIDDTFDLAKDIILEVPQPHNFHDPSDEDWVRFNGSYGRIYGIWATNLGSNCDVVLELYYADGTTLLEVQNNTENPQADEYLEWTCPNDGIYYIRVKQHEPCITNDTYCENTEYDLELLPIVGGILGFVAGTVKDAYSGNSIEGVTIETDGGGSAISLPNGAYIMPHPAGTFTVTAEGPGYYTKIYTGILVSEAGITTKDIDLVPVNYTDRDIDTDGISDEEESGPDGNDPGYDGNGDGTADSTQENVASLHTYNDQYYVTLEVPVGITITDCLALGNPSPDDVPSDIDFPYGFFEFTIEGMVNGGSSTVTLHCPAGSTFDTYYKFGPTPSYDTGHWYEFLYNNQTGAEIDGNIITLHFVDSIRGDDDLTANGIIVDVGGPGVYGSSANGSFIPVDCGTGSGCFIATAAYGSPIQPYVRILREFRDRFLLVNPIGKSFVQLYYTYSPPIADFIGNHDSLRAIVRVSLLPLIGASWIALKMGPVSTMALLCILIFGLVVIRRHKTKEKDRQAVSIRVFR